MPITHIVLFKFTPSTSDAQIKDISSRMIGLKDECKHPETKEVYVTPMGGGADCSPEGQAGGFTHGFVCSFENKKDRDYYLHEDPAHLAFVKSLDGLVADVRVVDFEPGVY